MSVAWRYTETEIVLEVEKVGEYQLEFAFGDRKVLSKEETNGKFVIRLAQ